MHARILGVTVLGIGTVLGFHPSDTQQAKAHIYIVDALSRIRESVCAALVGSDMERVSQCRQDVEKNIDIQNLLIVPCD